MSSLYDLLSTNTVVVTPNQRLAQTLINEWSKLQQKQVTKSPDCYAFTIWLRSLFNHIIDNTTLSHPILIEDLAAIRVWQHLINHQNQIPANNIILAEKLYQTWCQCQSYRCKIDLEQFNHNHQTQWFAKLALQFEKYLQQENLIVESQIGDYVCQYITILHPQKYIFVCFDQFTPQQQYLFECFANHNIQVELRDIDRIPASHIGKIAVDDTSQEHQAWINWIASQIEQGKRSIAAILPNLQDCATDIQRLLRYHFPPDQFNLSIGQSLMDYPMISQAVVLLNPRTSLYSDHDIRIFLSTPYIKGSQTEWLSRALILETNRHLKHTKVPKKIWLSEIEQNNPILHQLFDTLPPYPDQALPSEWAKCYHQRLMHFGFPGDYGLTSTLYQCYEKWQSVLNDFAQLDRVESLLPAEEAFELLKTLLKRTIFQPQSPSASIQVLGMLEAAGCEFDAIWMTGLTDLTLPATGQLTPFIPIPIQQKLGMPYASQEKEYQIAKKRLNRFQRSCDEFVVSYAHISDDKPNMPSPLINDYPDLPVPRAIQGYQKPNHWQIYKDPEALPLQIGESIRGGSRILANQAQCPFKAYAAHRLAIQDSEKAIDGLDSREKGTLVHLILQTIWEELENQDNLLAMATDGLDKLVMKTIDNCVPQVFQHTQTPFEQSVISLEKNKLHKLILNVLEEEKKRPPFHVSAVEQTCDYDFKQFSIKLKFDRLDTINEDGSKWIIDYKSTIPTGKPWLDDRPDDAQLLLYALLDDDIRTLSYMQIQSGNIKHQGFSEHPPAIKGIAAAKSKTWADYRLKWQNVVSDLADEFSKGIVRPQPKKTTICITCPYRQLCRHPLQTEDNE